MASPPASPPPARPMSGVFGMNRSTSRMSVSSRHGAGSRASDEDGKTSVKVAVRVRPPLRPTDPGFELIPQRYQRSMVHTSTPTGLTVESPQGKKFFIFDRVFGEDTLQEGIWDYVKDSVDSFMQGYNVSILAYGQSGSGKSYTMGTSAGGEQSDVMQMGVIPRAANVLFQKLQGHPGLNRNSASGLRTPTRYSMHGAQGLQGLTSAAKSQGDKSWQMKATYVEIYNEQLRDLLLPDEVPPSERPPVSIREDTKGRILLTGLRSVAIDSVEDLLRILNFGSSIRQTDSTAINAKSSRSHAVFSLNLIQKKNRAAPAPVNKRFSMPVESIVGAEDFVTFDSKLHFVDLAGSERLKNTGASGDRAKEGISINAGLASLGKVIAQLSSRHASTHISYRDSRLTRLLQDSLGGNAITYMIACVTPAEFHLSETLNTVQYAQRARAIQSKPQLQQVSDDGDKQAIIDRLRAEVSFLRQQIRSSEGAPHTPQERAERSNEREIELQNHLLDVQENYSALSQRHAKLISEITKARDDGDSGETPTLTEAIGDSAVERLKRSNSFAEAVEQVVLEYEKTIQTLENSLSNTRHTLSSTESTLLEKENRCAYVETLNQQLQSRIQKLIDRESSNEQYLHNLEAKLEGQSSGDDRSNALVAELRKEITRVRENEAQCEEYISTLEERLAEADQDLESKQRELDRLEHVIERQRSLGKLDSLIYEYDHLQQNGKIQKDMPVMNGGPKTSSKHRQRMPTLEEAANTVIPESDEEGEEERLPNGLALHKEGIEDSADADTPRAKKSHVAALRRQDVQHESPAQKRAVADKLENVTQELFDLRIQHESTVGEYDMLSAKYEEALRTLAAMQDTMDENRHATVHGAAETPSSTRPASFLEDARVSDLKDRGHLPSSRSLSSELSLAGDSNTSVEESPPQTKKSLSGSGSQRTSREEDLVREIDELKRTQLDKDEAMTNLKHTYSELQELHVETLDIVEELKTEVAKLKATQPQPPSSPVIRRKSSQNVMTIDRAHRSLASLKNIATDKFEDDSDAMQNFELNLNTAMHELHQRSERVQLLEGELTMLKREVENKNSMLSGLARERSSIKAASPIVDMSVLSQLNDQLVQREEQLRVVQEQRDVREHELRTEVDSLRDALDGARRLKADIPGGFPDTPDASSRQLQLDEHARLQDEVVQWRGKHKEAVDSMHASENKLLATIAELESSLTAVESMKDEAEQRAQRVTAAKSLPDGADNSDGSDSNSTIQALRHELNEHKTMSSMHSDKIARLAQLQESSREQAEEAARFREESEEQINGYRRTISHLESQIQEQQSAVDFHKHGLKTLHDSHAQELEALQTKLGDHETARSDMARSLQDMQDAHTGHITRLESEVIDLKAQLDKSRGSLSDELEQTQSTVRHLEQQRSDTAQQAESLKKELADTTRAQEIRQEELDKLRAEKDRAANLVEELEEQLSSSYEQQRANSTRLSQLHNTQNSQLQAVSEANTHAANLEKQLESSNTQVEQLQSQLRDSQSRESQQLDRGSAQYSSVRKSASVNSLPSPPPAIPLPPLPAGAVASPLSATFPHHTSTDGTARTTPSMQASASEIAGLQQTLTDRDSHIKQMEKHLFAEKQLTATLEEALVDLENQGKKTKADMESYRKKCYALEDEMEGIRREGKRVRDSVQQVEDEKSKRLEAERAREKLEERMKMLDGAKKSKKKSGFNCF